MDEKGLAVMMGRTVGVITIEGSLNSSPCHPLLSTLNTRPVRSMVLEYDGAIEIGRQQNIK